MFGTAAYISMLWESSSVEQPGRKSQSVNATQPAKTANREAVEELDVLVVGAAPVAETLSKGLAT
jgi:hypothetical protein